MNSRLETIFCYKNLKKGVAAVAAAAAVNEAMAAPPRRAAAAAVAVHGRAACRATGRNGLKGDVLGVSAAFGCSGVIVTFRCVC